MLMSLKAGNLGLNMVAACRVILLDLWWNPTTEDQAVDRAHRIGQTRTVTVSRLTVKDTVEDRILSLQVLPHSVLEFRCLILSMQGSSIFVNFGFNWLICFQEDKRKMVASAFGEDGSGGHATKLGMDDLRFLFEGPGH